MLGSDRGADKLGEGGKVISFLLFAFLCSFVPVAGCLWVESVPGLTASCRRSAEGVRNERARDELACED